MPTTSNRGNVRLALEQDIAEVKFEGSMAGYYLDEVFGYSKKKKKKKKRAVASVPPAIDFGYASEGYEVSDGVRRIIVDGVGGACTLLDLCYPCYVK